MRTSGHGHEGHGDDGATRHLVEALQGLLGIAAFLVAVLLVLSVIPMLGRRVRMAIADAQGKAVPATGSKVETVREPEVALPPIEYGIACDGTDREIRDALIDDLSSMRDASGPWPPAWITLPRPVLPSDGEPAPRHVMDLVNGVYADYPEFSVYTDGQCVSATGFLSQWHVEGEGDGTTQEENARELRQVTERLDAVATELADATDSPGYAAEREALGPDRLYAALVYRWVGSRTRYADGQDDTSHANDIYGAVMEDEAQCYGTACAMKALLERGGIPALVVTGVRADGTAGRHAWVVTRMGGRWLSLDGTGAQVLCEGDPIDLGAISDRRGRWFSFMVPLDERLEVSRLELEPMCEKVMRRYEELVEPLEQDLGMAGGE